MLSRRVEEFRGWAAAKAAFVAAWGLVVCAPAVASEHEIATTFVNGRPCVRGTLTGPAGTIPASFVLELGMAQPIIVHARTARMLGLSGADTVSLTLGDLRLTNVPLTTRDMDSLVELSGGFADELGNVPAVAYVGMTALQGWTIELDLPAGALRLRDPTGGKVVPQEGGEVEPPARRDARTAYGTEVFLDYVAARETYWLQARGPGEKPLRVRLSTAQPHTLIDRNVAREVGAPAGDLELLKLRRLDIIKHVALRPVDLGGGDPERAAVVLGTDLLESFRLTVEPARRQLRLLQIRPTRNPAAEREFYRIQTRENADALEAWLANHGTSRLAAEAAALLLTWRLNSPSPEPQQIQAALARVTDATPVGRRAQELIRLSNDLAGRRKGDAATYAQMALDLAERFAEQDVNARAVHDIQARRGHLALRRGDFQTARRHLLSAMFGLPRDPQINLWMGELYEKMGKPTRAWSRYVQALLADESLVKAQRGLDRLHHDPSFGRRFGGIDAIQLLEGRVPAFQPSRRCPDPDGNLVKCSGQLVELFTSVDVADTAAAELALQGLAHYMKGIPLHVIQYHHAGAQADPLATLIGAARAARYDVNETPVAMFGGQRPLDGGGSVADVAMLFDEYQFAAELLDWERVAPRLSGEARLKDGVLSVTLRVEGIGEMRGLRAFAIVCASAVVLPGANGVFLHRHVARHALTPAEGLVLEPAAKGTEAALKVTQDEVDAVLTRHVKQVEQTHEVEFHMRPTRVQLDDCYVIAFLQRDESDAVEAVCRIEIAR